MKFAIALILTTLLVACGARTSDEEQVRALVDDMEKAAEERDTSDVVEHVADDYEDGNGFDKSRLRDFLRAWFLTHSSVELIVSIESLEFPADGVAQAVITVTNVTITDPDRVRLRVEFRRKGEEWRVSRADRISR